MKIFYSWQSDTPKEVGRTFIREVLDAAVAGLEVDEAERPIIDQDTQGVLGSPVIADTIFQKIRAANVVVADVTLTGQTRSGKRLINSNVAVELGYAMGIHDDEVLLKVMNTHYSSPKHLPFDLAHRRWPVQYDLPPEAAPEVRQQVRDTLVLELRAILEAYIQASRPPPQPFAPTPATINAATYWRPNETIVPIGDARFGDKIEGLQFDPSKPLMYLRIWPDQLIQPLSNQILNNELDKSVIEPVCGTASGWSSARNKYGRITFALAEDRILSGTTQVFRNGEIWSVNHHPLRQREGLPRLVPMGAVEQRIGSSLHKYFQAARSHFSYPAKIHFEFGLVNVLGFRLALPDRYGGELSEEIFENVRIVGMVDMQNEGQFEAAKEKILKEVYEAAGLTLR
jgi:hypothetical protein